MADSFSRGDLITGSEPEATPVAAVEADALDADGRRTRICNEINRLSNTDLLRLNAYARVLAPGSPQDLYQEAIERTISGKRRWPPLDNTELPFVQFVLGAMRSIANSWRRDPYETRRRWKRSLNTDSRTDIDPLENIPSTEAPIDEEILRQELRRILQRELSDKVTLGVVKARLMGCKRAEILQELGITLKQYATIYKRLQRRLKVVRGEVE